MESDSGVLERGVQGARTPGWSCCPPSPVPCGWRPQAHSGFIFFVPAQGVCGCGMHGRALPRWARCCWPGFPGPEAGVQGVLRGFPLHSARVSCLQPRLAGFSGSSSGLVSVVCPSKLLQMETVALFCVTGVRCSRMVLLAQRPGHRVDAGTLRKGGR